MKSTHCGRKYTHGLEGVLREAIPLSFPELSFFFFCSSGSASVSFPVTSASVANVRVVAAPIVELAADLEETAKPREWGFFDRERGLSYGEFEAAEETAILPSGLSGRQKTWTTKVSTGSERTFWACADAITVLIMSSLIC